MRYFGNFHKDTTFCPNNKIKLKKNVFSCHGQRDYQLHSWQLNDLSESNGQQCKDSGN